MRIALQMDPIEGIRVGSDSSHIMGVEACKRGYEVYYYQPGDLSYEDGKVFAMGHRISLFADPLHYYELAPRERIDLGKMDVILLRQDPPFNMAYITSTYLLDRLPDSVLVINNPTSVRHCAEKMFPLDFRQFMPPTLITKDVAAMEAFLEKHKEIIIKPIYGHGGSGVMLIHDASNLGGLMDVYRMSAPLPVIAQKYIPEVKKGDKRIIFVDGKPIGGFLRVADRGFRSNLVLGGKAVYDELTKREKEICKTLGPELKKRGLLLVGIDVIAGYLTEINVTSPTGLGALNPHIPVSGESILWDHVEKMKAAKKKK